MSDNGIADKFIAAANKAIELYDEGVAEGPLQDIEGVIDRMRDLLVDAVDFIKAHTDVPGDLADARARIAELEAARRDPDGHAVTVAFEDALFELAEVTHV
ncbi:hypothetical protein C5E45_32870 [Nocardia nova]|uniref:Uncharacterized protein n=1 Tax=Nocardia nova TaxID=37330 RepID=A0A2S6ACT9_9NOCA|nr:hypothetical protein [Nocardia nova]PPJ31885.1 hypothetical protein C5E45_32870 [Nocardia nova]